MNKKNRLEWEQVEGNYCAYLHYWSNRNHPIIVVERDIKDDKWFVCPHYGALQCLFEKGKKFKTKKACINYAKRIIKAFGLLLMTDVDKEDETK